MSCSEVETTSITVAKPGAAETAAPQTRNASAENHVIVFGERHLLETLVEHARHFDEARTHQGIGQLVPAGCSTPAVGRGAVIATPVLGLHHDCRRAA